MKAIQYDELLAALREVVEEADRDFVYSTRRDSGDCTYVHDQKPDCIIGRALYKLGTPISRLQHKNYTGIGLRADLNMTNEARAFARLVQLKQDQGVPWGPALDEAIMETSA